MNVAEVTLVGKVRRRRVGISQEVVFIDLEGQNMFHRSDCELRLLDNDVIRHVVFKGIPDSVECFYYGLAHFFYLQIFQLFRHE